jgi:glycosyltransferase involved in cell wall biosynthesis
MSDERPVALVMPNLAGGGAERVFLDLCRGLRSLDLPIDLVLFDARGPLRDHVPDDVRLINLETHRAASAIPKLTRYQLRRRPRAIISALTHANLACVLAAAFVRPRPMVICTEHIDFGRVRLAGTSYRERYLPLIAGRAYQGADHVVAVSAGVASSLVAHGVPESKVTVIPNPIDAARIRALALEPANHSWFHLPLSEPVIVAAGRLTAQKDYATLLHAFRIVLHQRAVRLLILGEGVERESLHAMIHRLGLAGAVDLFGFAGNPYPYISRASLLALSSRWEGLPTVLIEALLLGTPVISTDCPSGPREILDGGRLGALVEVGNAEELATALLNGLSEPHRRPPPDFEQSYTLLAVARRYASLLQYS